MRHQRLEAVIAIGFRGLVLGATVALLAWISAGTSRGETIAAVAGLLVAIAVGAAATIEHVVPAPRSAAGSAFVAVLGMGAAWLALAVAAINVAYAIGEGGLDVRLSGAEAGVTSAIRELAAGRQLAAVLGGLLGSTAPLGIATWHRLEAIRRYPSPGLHLAPAIEATAVFTIILACAIALFMREALWLSSAVPLFTLEGAGALSVLLAAAGGETVGLVVVLRVERHDDPGR